MERTGATPSTSIPASSMHELYRLRALITAFGSVVPLSGVAERRSESQKLKNIYLKVFCYHTDDI
jgi:hypothetical protein